jgi:DNA-binding HxlR family transcriptional regulator
MKYDKLDVLRLVLQPYALDVLHSLAGQPKRFSELAKEVKNERTLSLNLVKLIDSGLIKTVSKKKDGKFINYYSISERGKKMLAKLERL